MLNRPWTWLLLAPLTFSGIACAQNNAAAPRDRWGLQPLGPDVKPRHWTDAPIRQQLKTHLNVLPASGEKLVLCKAGQAQATIILAKDSTTAARGAAKQLRETLQAITGAQFPIEEETGLASAPAPTPFLIVIGDTKLGRDAGINADDLPAEGYRLKTRGNTLFIVGQDKAKSGIEIMGTRHAVFALLERHFGCRWLWPGPLGTIIPRQTTLELAPLDESDAPAMVQRILRNMHRANQVQTRTQVGLRRLQRTDAEFLARSTDSYLWLDAQRLGSSVSLKYGHAYRGWWDKYGATHPEWFALQANGARQQLPERERLDVTEPGLIQAVAEQAMADLKQDPTLKAAAISPNDGGLNEFCLCEECRKLDPPQAPKTVLRIRVNGERRAIKYPSLSDRYATFYSKVAEIVARQYPDRWLGAFAYSAYRTPPLYAKMHPNVLVSFVGLGYFDDHLLQDDRESWNGWANAADKMVLRPNLLLEGHGFPAVYVHKLAVDLKHCYATGMMAADFDGLQHNWASQGLNYYVLVRLLWDPSQNVDDIVADYCKSGFGPAAQPIQKYFARLEQLTDSIAAHDSKTGSAPTGTAPKGELRDEEEEVVSDYDHFLKLAPQYYTPQMLEELQSLLDKAKQAAGGDETVRQRIDFLAVGLRYAAVQAPLMRLRWMPESPERNARILELLATRERTYREIFDKDFYAVNVAYLTYREGDAWRAVGWNPAHEK